MSSTFKGRLIEAMQIRDMTQADLVKATGLSKPRISQYVNGTYEAKQQALYVLAEALNVNISWLMGNDVPMEINYEKLQSEVNACELFEKCYGKEAFQAVKLFLQLDTLDRGRIIGSMETLLNNEKYNIQKESSDEKAI